MRHRRPNPPSFLDRAAAAAFGAGAGALAYLGWATFSAFRGNPTEAWSLTGPLKWWACAGALLGALGGLRFARWLWEQAVDELRLDAAFTGGAVLGIIVIVVIVAVALSL